MTYSFSLWEIREKNKFISDMNNWWMSCIRFTVYGRILALFIGLTYYAPCITPLIRPNHNIRHSPGVAIKSLIGVQVVFPEQHYICYCMSAYTECVLDSHPCQRQDARPLPFGTIVGCFGAKNYACLALHARCNNCILHSFAFSSFSSVCAGFIASPYVRHDICCSAL
jgi:hypothetical protein